MLIYPRFLVGFWWNFWCGFLAFFSIRERAPFYKCVTERERGKIVCDAGTLLICNVNGPPSGEMDFSGCGQFNERDRVCHSNPLYKLACFLVVSWFHLQQQQRVLSDGVWSHTCALERSATDAAFYNRPPFIQEMHFSPRLIMNARACVWDPLTNVDLECI